MTYGKCLRSIEAMGEVPEESASREGTAFWVPRTITIPSNNVRDTEHERGVEGIGNENLQGSRNNARHQAAVNVDSQNDKLFEQTHRAHSWMKTKSRYYQRVRNEIGDRFSQADDGRQVWCEERVKVHPYDVIDHILIVMFRDTNRHRYVRCINNSLGVLRSLAYSLFVMSGDVSNIRQVQEWELSQLKFCYFLCWE